MFERKIENSRDEEVCRAWDVLAEQDHTYHMSEEEYFHYRENWWISLKKSENDTQPVRKRWTSSKHCLHLKRSHQEAGGDQLEPIPYRKYKQWRTASRSSCTWWQWKESWWSSWEFKESQERRGKQRLVIERGNPLFTELWWKPQTNGCQEFILFFVTDRSFTVDGGLL